MDLHDSLKLLQETAVKAAGERLLNNITPDQVRVTYPDEKLESLERFAPQRFRFHGTFISTVLAQFIAYVVSRDKEVHQSPFRTFVDADAVQATTFFNIGDTQRPGHADDRAVLKLKPVAAYAALLSFIQSRRSQKDLAEFIEEYSPYLRAYGEAAGGGAEYSAMSLGAAIAAVRKVTIKQKSEVGNEARNHGATRTALESIDAQADGGLPVFLAFTTEPYPGFTSREFRLRVATITGDTPLFALRIVNKELHDEAIASEFCLLLRELGDEPNSLVVGSFTP